MSFRYYLYISDSKVDMLLPQIDPGFTARRTSEIGVDLKVLTAKRTGGAVSADRTARLERVLRYLQDFGDLGSVDEPGQFFWGLLPMRWGPFPGQVEPSPVFFGGRTDRTVVGLGGSSRHLLGSAPGGGAMFSLMPPLLRGLGTESDLEDEILVDTVNGDQEDRSALAVVQRAVERLKGPAQNVEFVAKRLLDGDSPYPESVGMSVLLGSPVYVALVD
ncbi:DUF7019 family protein [Streptomyces nodosus]|uniref:DUF7019 family protein n=1 Tax=Streptomyces nodosus TaxID=40318 RepID=UPI0036EEA9D2